MPNAGVWLYPGSNSRYLSIMDEDLDHLDRLALISEVKKLRSAIREHRDATGHDLCWYYPEMWSLLPEGFDIKIAVPPWPEFMRGCIRYRQSLDEHRPHAKPHGGEFKAE